MDTRSNSYSYTLPIPFIPMGMLPQTRKSNKKIGNENRDEILLD